VSVYQRPVNGQVRARRWRYERQHNTQIFFCFSAHLDAARIRRRGRRDPDDYFTSATFMLLFTKRRRPGGRAGGDETVRRADNTAVLFRNNSAAARTPTDARTSVYSLARSLTAVFLGRRRTNTSTTTKNLVAASE